MSLEKTKAKAKSIFSKIMWILFFTGLLFGTSYYFYRTYTLSEGTRMGMLFKISRKGKIFKTYEGQMQLAGATMMSKQSIWDFSVVDDKTYMELQNLEAKTVRLHYKEVVDAFPWQGETNYLVYKVELIK